MKRIAIILAMATLIFFAACRKKQESASGGSDIQGFDWKRYSGKTLVVSAPANNHYRALQAQLPDFKELTGITVEFDMINYARLHDKQVLEFAKPVGDFDVVSLVVMWKTEYVKGDNLVELEPLFDDPNLAMPGYDFDDLIPGFVENTGIAGGERIYMNGPGAKLYALPYGAETSIFAYRKDILEKHNIPVPTNYEELVEACRLVKEMEPGMYGMAFRGASGHQATAGWLNIADPLGAKIFDANWNPIVDNEASITTLNFLQKMIEYGPPGIPSMTVNEVDAIFVEGKAAFYIDHDKIYAIAENPEQSKIVGKVGYELLPEGPNGRMSETGGFGLGIPSNSANKEAAFLFLQWATSKGVAEKATRDTGVTPNRWSVMKNPEFVEKYDPFYTKLTEQLAFADPDWRPIIPEWGEINSIMGVEVNNVLTGTKTPEEAMADAKSQMIPVMQKYGYIE